MGEAPDRRSVATLHRAGIEMGDLRARKMRKVDFHDFDLILAMDNSHLAALKRMAPEDATAEIALYVEYAMGKPAEVPDPYYGGPTDFARVVELIDDATTALLARLNT